MAKTYYEVLGVPSVASDDEIQQAYRSLAKRFHPDSGQETSERFLELQEAYEALGDPARRQRYDNSLHSIGGHWTQVYSSTPFRHIQLHSDGAITINGQCFRPVDAISEMQFGAATIAKPAGKGQVLAIVSKQQRHSFRFLNGGWQRHFSRESRSPAPATLITTSVAPKSGRSQTLAPVKSDAKPGAGHMESSRWSGNKVASLAVAALFVAALVTVFGTPGNLMSVFQSAADAGDDPSSAGVTGTNNDSVSEKAADETARKENEHRQAVAKARDKLNSIQLLADNALIAADKLQATLTKWNNEIVPLWTNDRGRTLAADPNSIAAFEKYYQGITLDFDQATQFKDRILKLIQPVKQASRLSDDVVLRLDPSPGLEQRLRDITQEAENQNMAIEQRLTQIESLLNAAADNAQNRSQETLEEAVRERDTKEAAELAAEAEQIRQRIRDEFRDKHLKEVERKLRIEEQQKLDDAMDANGAAEEELAHQKRLKEAASPKIKKLLAVFFVEGNAQPDGTQSNPGRPVSLACLRRSNILNNDPNGQGIGYMLSFVGGRYPDRKAFPGNVLMNLLPADQERAREMHRALINYADELQELGLLDP